MGDERYGEELLAGRPARGETCGADRPGVSASLSPFVGERDEGVQRCGVARGDPTGKQAAAREPTAGRRRRLIGRYSAVAAAARADSKALLARFVRVI